MNSQFTIALVGAGNMGGAMLSGWLAQGMASNRIAIVDPAISAHRRQGYEAQGVRVHLSASDCEPFDIVVLAVKPQIMADVLPQIHPLCGKGTVCVSVAAGVTLDQLANGLPPETAVIRTMPNTPALISRGVTVACGNETTNGVQRDQVGELLGAIGICEWVEDEQLMDAVTAVSGSGPAYVFHLTECMASAGVKAGLPADLAMSIAKETVAGAGELMVRSQAEPSELRKNVTSPNGTTAAALEVFMGEERLCRLVADAIDAASTRSRQLSRSDS